MKTKAGRRASDTPAECRARAASGRLRLVEPGVHVSEGDQVRANNLGQGPALAGFTFHDMCHTAVSLGMAAGTSDLEVAKWAGHRSAACTKSRYAHLFPEHGEALADRLEAFIVASTSTPVATVTSIRDVRQVCATANFA